jgi:hypothetical protein
VDGLGRGAPPAQGIDPVSRPPLADLVAEPRRVSDLSLDAVVDILDACAVEHGRLAQLERLAYARLRTLVPGAAAASDDLLTAAQAARRLGVSVDYVRVHGAALGIAVPLDGVVRYDPAAIAALRAARRPSDK